MPKVKKEKFTYAKGRRRTASARVRLHKGKGESTINDKAVNTYLTTEAQRIKFNKPFVLTGTTDKFYVTVKVAGGGLEGQLGAITLGIARALNELDNEHRSPLKKAGLLTRDGRIRERRKVGMGGKARRKKQSPKR